MLLLNSTNKPAYSLLLAPQHLDEFNRHAGDPAADGFIMGSAIRRRRVSAVQWAKPRAGSRKH
jgi:hypothetical protein